MRSRASRQGIEADVVIDAADTIGRRGQFHQRGRFCSSHRQWFLAENIALPRRERRPGLPESESGWASSGGFHIGPRILQQSRVIRVRSRGDAKAGWRYTGISRVSDRGFRRNLDSRLDAALQSDRTDQPRPDHCRTHRIGSRSPGDVCWAIQQKEPGGTALGTGGLCAADELELGRQASGALEFHFQLRVCPIRVRSAE